MVDDPVLSVMVLGETGVGKSSVINLIVGENIARDSSNVEVCTRHTTRYAATVESMRMHIWEVSGFNQSDRDLRQNAFDTEDKFRPMLEARARVNVILFCMRGQKLTVTTKQIFERIHGIFERQIPIVLVINHLERERDMEDWWRRNRDRLGTSMSGTRHVCVTGLRNQENSRRSREQLVAVLRGTTLVRGAADRRMARVGWLGSVADLAVGELCSAWILYFTSKVGYMRV
ncbi:P-loop containing nucleoside triphosphate hydrolase protein [Pisolithus thermaeus]|nr:P-loop containing nucleoside triphosphate hydrolase protein [Pisolithus thermaeus]